MRPSDREMIEKIAKDEHRMRYDGSVSITRSVCDNMSLHQVNDSIFTDIIYISGTKLTP